MSKSKQMKKAYAKELSLALKSKTKKTNPQKTPTDEHLYFKELDEEKTNEYC